MSAGDFIIYTFQLFFDNGHIARGTRRFENFLDEIIEKRFFTILSHVMYFTPFDCEIIRVAFEG